MNPEIKRKFQGVWIPAAIWLDRSLSITEKVMLVEINSLENPSRGCFASNEHFSAFFDLSKSRVSEIISGLAAKDLIRVDLIRDGKQIVERQIWMTEKGSLVVGGPSSENTNTPLRETQRPSSENTNTPFGKQGDPSSEKAKGSNTDFNNTTNNTLNKTHTPSVCDFPTTPAGLCCKAIIQQGIKSTNQHNPIFIALLEAGATEQEFANAAKTAVSKGKPDFPYVIGIVKKQREDAAKLVLHQGKLPNKQDLLEKGNREATQRAKARLFGSSTEKDVTNETTRL
jgi:hypothetical protein